MENLPALNECVFVHYSCAVYQNDPKERVYAIGVRADERTKLWYANNETQANTWDSCNEVEEATAIRSLYDFLLNYPQKIIIHWNMHGYQFGPDHLARRYEKLTGLTLPEITNKWLNMANHLWHWHGEYYSYWPQSKEENKCHKRLENLCALNSIDIYGYHVDGENYNTIHKMGNKVVTYLAAFEKIHYKESRGILTIGSEPKDLSKGKTKPLNIHGTATRPQQLQDIFTSSEAFTKAIDAIRQYGNVINSNGEWIGRTKQKCVIVAWVDRLQRLKMIPNDIDYRSLVPLLEKQFPGLELGTEARNFSNPAPERVRLAFASLMPE